MRDERDVNQNVSSVGDNSPIINTLGNTTITINTGFGARALETASDWTDRLSDEARWVLIHARTGTSRIMICLDFEEPRVFAGTEDFPVENTPRAKALWRKVKSELLGLGVMDDVTNDGTLFDLNAKGFEIGDRLARNDLGGAD